MDRKKAEQILLELSECACHDDPKKFYFAMKETHEVMLLTWHPSFQAVARPLSSIRFFRLLMLALFGAKPILQSGDLINTFLDKIYWTHYCKCHIANKENEPYPLVVPDTCYLKYLEKEVSTLNPKLIIVLGKPILNFIAQHIQEGTLFGRPMIYNDFPSRGDEPEFELIRKEMKKIIPQVDDVTIAIDDVKIIEKEKQQLNAIEVHAYFERDGLIQYWAKIKEELNKHSISTVGNEAWYREELIPRWTRYSFIVSCYSFMEDQLKPLLSRQDRTCLENQRRKTLYLVLDWLMKRHNLPYNKKLEDKLENLRHLRNSIVHAGGIINQQKGRNLAQRIPGVMFEPTGAVKVTNETCEFALITVNDFVDTIRHFPQRNGAG